MSLILGTIVFWVVLISIFRIILSLAIRNSGEGKGGV